MRVAILALGSRGDVQPYVALARGLAAAGHDVVLAAPVRFGWLVEPYAVPWTPLEHDPLKGIRGLLGLRAPTSLAGRWRSWRETAIAAFEEWLAVTADRDFLLAHPGAIAAPDIAERRGIPLAFASTLPTLCPTREFPCTFIAGRTLGPWGNRASYGVLHTLLLPIRRTRDVWRRARLGLPGPSSGSLRRPDGSPVLHLHGHSESVLPTPGDWEREWKTVGYWTLPPPEGWAPPDELVGFLEAGSPPVYVGFGSMTHPRAPELTRAVVQGVLNAGARLLVARGSGALVPREAMAVAGAESRVLALDGWEGVPHEWLLPRVSAVIHHGGPGTLGAAVRAGRPQICCPFGMDQPFWAGRARRLGVSPSPLPVRRLTAATLSSRVREVLMNGRYRDRADALGRQVRDEEDGVTRAVREIATTPFRPRR